MKSSTNSTNTSNTSNSSAVPVNLLDQGNHASQPKTIGSKVTSSTNSSMSSNSSAVPVNLLDQDMSWSQSVSQFKAANPGKPASTKSSNVSNSSSISMISNSSAVPVNLLDQDMNASQSKTASSKKTSSTKSSNVGNSSAAPVNLLDQGVDASQPEVFITTIRKVSPLSATVEDEPSSQVSTESEFPSGLAPSGASLYEATSLRGSENHESVLRHASSRPFTDSTSGRLASESYLYDATSLKGSLSLGSGVHLAGPPRPTLCSSDPEKSQPNNSASRVQSGSVGSSERSLGNVLEKTYRQLLQKLYRALKRSNLQITRRLDRIDRGSIDNVVALQLEFSLIQEGLTKFFSQLDSIHHQAFSNGVDIKVECDRFQQEFEKLSSQLNAMAADIQALTKTSSASNGGHAHNARVAPQGQNDLNQGCCADLKALIQRLDDRVARLEPTEPSNTSTKIDVHAQSEIPRRYLKDAKKELKVCIVAEREITIGALNAAVADVEIDNRIVAQDLRDDLRSLINSVNVDLLDDMEYNADRVKMSIKLSQEELHNCTATEIQMAADRLQESIALLENTVQKSREALEEHQEALQLRTEEGIETATAHLHDGIELLRARTSDELAAATGQLQEGIGGLAEGIEGLALGIQALHDRIAEGFTASAQGMLEVEDRIDLSRETLDGDIRLEIAESSKRHVHAMKSLRNIVCSDLRDHRELIAEDMSMIVHESHDKILSEVEDMMINNRDDMASGTEASIARHFKALESEIDLRAKTLAITLPGQTDYNDLRDRFQLLSDDVVENRTRATQQTVFVVGEVQGAVGGIRADMGHLGWLQFLVLAMVFWVWLEYMHVWPTFE